MLLQKYVHGAMTVVSVIRGNVLMCRQDAHARPGLDLMIVYKVSIVYQIIVQLTVLCFNRQPSDMLS